MTKTTKKMLLEKDFEIVKQAIDECNIDVIKENIERIANENQNLVSKTSVKLPNKKTNDFYNVLKGNLESEILSSHTSEVSDLSKDVKKYMNRQLGYIGFVFYIWNPKNLNMKIIPLTQINPILDLTNVKEFYFLYRPAMFIDGKPVFWIIRGIPFSFELNLIKERFKTTDNNGNITEKEGNLIKDIELKGYSSSEIRALLRSGFTTYLFGKPSLSRTQLLYLIFMIFTICLIEYIVLSNIFMGFT